MKAIKAVLIACAATLLGSCEQRDGNISPNGQINATSLTDKLTNPNGLIIRNFTEDGRNKTSLFREFVFNFNSNGTVVVTNADQTINGTYNVFRDDGRTELLMNFPNRSELYELSDDWYFVSNDNNIIKFEEGGDTLEFQKQ